MNSIEKPNDTSKANRREYLLIKYKLLLTKNIIFKVAIKKKNMLVPSLRS